MSTNHTPNYQLNQWEPEDKVVRTDFNADNAKIDAALARKAEASALTALQAAVAQKAEVSAVEALKTTVTGKGNCQIVTGAYYGDGKVGASHSNSLFFSKVPVLLLVYGPAFGIMVNSHGFGYIIQGGTNEKFTTEWSGTGVSWYCDIIDAPASRQLNVSGKRYYYTAFLEA